MALTYYLRSIIFCLLVSLIYAANNKCYKCASAHIVEYWPKYMPIYNEMSGDADKHCIEQTKISQIVLCAGPCFVMNVTGLHENGTMKTYGILRDCQTSHWSKSVVIPEDQDKICRISHRRVFRKDVKVEYCFFKSYLGNGKIPNEIIDDKPAYSKRMSAYHKNNLGENNVATKNIFLYLFVSFYLLFQN